MNELCAASTVFFFLLEGSQLRRYLIPELLSEAGGLVQGETGHQRGGEDVAGAQLVDHVGHVEERVALQQLPDTQTAGQRSEVTGRSRPSGGQNVS